MASEWLRGYRGPTLTTILATSKSYHDPYGGVEKHPRLLWKWEDGYTLVLPCSSFGFSGLPRRHAGIIVPLFDGWGQSWDSSRTPQDLSVRYFIKGRCCNFSFGHAPLLTFLHAASLKTRKLVLFSRRLPSRPGFTHPGSSDVPTPSSLPSSRLTTRI